MAHQRTHTTRRRSGSFAALVAIVAVGIASCGTDAEPSAATSTTLAVTGQATPADATTAPTEPTMTDDTGPGTTTEPSAASSETAETGPSAEPRDPIRQNAPLPAGRYHTSSMVGPLLDIELDLPTDGLFALDEEGALALALDGAGGQTLVAIFHLDNGNVVDPTVDTALFVDRTYVESVTDPVPPDFLEWIGTRPGVTSGPIEEVAFGGVPARRRTLEFGDFEGATPCIFGDDRACHHLFAAPVTGLVLLQNVGDGVVVYELSVAGHRLAVLVDTTYDAITSASIAESVRFVVTPHPAAPAESEPLPFVGPIATGTTYAHERSSGGVWLIEGVDGVGVTAGVLRDRFVRFESDGADCGALTDASQGFWFAQALLPDGSTAADGIKIPDDLEAALRASADLELVDGPVEVDLGGVTGVSFDVRPVGDADVALANTSILAVAGSVTRIVAAPRDDAYGPDLATVTLGSDCEGLLDGLVFVPGSER